MDERTYIATRHVRHVAAWIARADQADSTYRVGEYRPICGTVAQVNWPRESWEPRPLWAVVEDGDPRWSLPVCKRCIRAAKIIYSAAADIPTGRV